MSMSRQMRRRRGNNSTSRERISVVQRTRRERRLMEAAMKGDPTAIEQMKKKRLA